MGSIGITFKFREMKYNAIDLFNNGASPDDMRYFDGFRDALKKLRDLGVIEIEPLPLTVRPDLLNALERIKEASDKVKTTWNTNNKIIRR